MPELVGHRVPVLTEAARELERTAELLAQQSRVLGASAEELHCTRELVLSATPLQAATSTQRT